MKFKRKKALLAEQYERERAYLANQEVGSEEYNASLRRLMELETHLTERKSKVTTALIETGKVAANVALPLIGLVWITANERDITFTGALRDYTKYFLPKTWK